MKKSHKIKKLKKKGLVFFILIIILVLLVFANEPEIKEGDYHIINLSDGHGHFGKLLVGNVSYLDLDDEFHVHGDSHFLGDLNVSGNIDLTKIGNPTGKLKIQPNATGNVELFGDTDVGNNENGKMFYVRRQAAEGNDYIRFYVSQSRIGYIHSDVDLVLQGQNNFIINAVTKDILFRMSDNAGAKKVYFQDSDNNDVATIDSDGNAWFDGSVGIGVSSPSGDLKLDVAGSNPIIRIGSTKNGEWTVGQQLGGLEFYGSDYSTPSIGVKAEISMLSKNTYGANFDMAFKIQNTSGTLTELMRILQNGNVGIGTTNPQLPLEIRSDDDNQAMFFDSRRQAQGVGGGFAFGGKYTDAGAEAMAGRIGVQKTNAFSGDVGFNMVFQTQDSGGTITDRIEILSDGKVGIGDITPTKILDVNGDTRIRGDLTIDNTISPLTFASSTGAKINLYGSNYAIGVESSEFRIASNSKISFRTDGYNGKEDVVISDDGFLGIGISTPHDELHINSTSPRITLEESDAGNSEKVWFIGANGEEFSIKTASDLYSATQTVFQTANRGGTGIQYVEFPNDELRIGDTNTGSNTGTHICIDANDALCRCGSCA